MELPEPCWRQGGSAQGRVAARSSSAQTGTSRRLEPRCRGRGRRIYFGKDGERIVILLGGSAKKRQSAAVTAAHAASAGYNRRKRGKE